MRDNGHHVCHVPEFDMEIEREREGEREKERSFRKVYHVDYRNVDKITKRVKFEKSKKFKVQPKKIRSKTTTVKLLSQTLLIIFSFL